MKATETTLNDFLSQSKTQFVIPVYQRNYDWSEDQCQQLFRDILEVGTNSNTHFIGSIVYLHDGVYTSSDVKQLVVIDGQQRLTTFSILYLALYNFCRENNLLEIGDEIFDTYIINKYVKNDDFKLKLKQSDQNFKAFKYLIAKNDSFSYEEYSKIINNYNFFRSVINNETIEIIRKGLNRLLFVEISLERGKDDPQRIFESLNSTGLELSQADLIRNYILMGLTPDNQKKIFDEYWDPIEINARDYVNQESRVSDFIRDYLTYKNRKIPKRDSVYIEFKNKYKNRNEQFYTDILLEIKNYSVHYSKLLNPEKELNFNIRQELNYVKRLEINVAFPFLLPVYEDYVNQQIGVKDFIDILKLIQSYIWRRFIVGIPTQSLNKIFMSLYAEVDKKNYLFSIQKYLLKKRSYQRFPTDSEVEAHLFDKDIYNIQSRNLTYFLELLENYNNKEFVSVDNPAISVEHIYPQNPDKSWYNDLSSDQNKLFAEKYLNTLANLTLSGNNGFLSNKSFQEKKYMNKNNGEQGYAYSRLWLNKYLQIIENWDIQSLKERFSLLFDRFLKIWEFPSITIDIESDEDEDYYIYNIPDARNKKLDYFIFRDEKITTNELSKMYYHVIKIIIEEHPTILTNDEMKFILGISSNPKDLRMPYQINSTYYIESNLDNNSKIRRLKTILTSLNLEDELLINFSNPDFEQDDEEVNRGYWEEKVGLENLKIVDSLYNYVLKIDENLTLNYTIGYIGFSQKGKVDNFLVMIPKTNWLRVNIKVKNINNWISKLQSLGVDVIAPGKYNHRIKIRLHNNKSINDLQKIEELISDAYLNR